MLMGIDSGQTALKVLVVDDTGQTRGSATRPTHTLTPAPHQLERSMSEVRDQCDAAIREALTAAGIAGDAVDAVDAVGIVAHGDGIYPVDDNGSPVRSAILAVDTRAHGLLATWRADGVVRRAVDITGQEPFAGSLAPLVAWLVEHEPQTAARTRWFLACKDWLRLGLTGEVATDLVEASSSVGDPSGGYSTAAIAAYGLDGLADKLPQIYSPADVAGTISPDAAARTGLRRGTPVVTGTHDVVAAALGAGARRPGDLCAVAGTYSVNQLITSRRLTDPRWQARPYVDPQSWILMGASPTSATNFEWFIRNLMAEVNDPLEVADREVRATLDHPSSVHFHPFLFGSPFDGPASASFVGVQGWHNRGHLIRAVFEGVVFNHCYHLDAFNDIVTRDRLRLTGGASRSQVWCQMFAEALDCQVDVAANPEPGALGAAMLAGVGAGFFSGFDEAQKQCVQVAHSYWPTPGQRERWDEAYQRHLTTAAAVRGVWQTLDAAGGTP